MNDRLRLAEAYYAVANDLRIQGERMLEMAEVLDRNGSMLCEQNMRETPLVQGCHRAHPHENMDAECERLTELARGAHPSPTVREPRP
jgi:hypothetical protein